MTTLAEVKADLQAWYDRNAITERWVTREAVGLLLAALPPTDEEPALSAFEKPDRPLIQLSSARKDQPEWMQINFLFDLCGLAAPPTRLRDALVSHLIWARYAEELEVSSRPAQPAGEPVASIKIDEMFRSVDNWGAREWFDRLVDAVINQDRCVVADDEMNAETYRMIASSSAARLAREYAAEIRAALANPSPQPADMEKAFEAAKDAYTLSYTDHDTAMRAALTAAAPFLRGAVEVPPNCPPVGVICDISGTNSDYNDKWTYTTARVIAYTPDGIFGWFQKEGCWPWQERLANCRFRASSSDGDDRG